MHRQSALPHRTLSAGLLLLLPLFYLPVGMVLIQAFRGADGTWDTSLLIASLSSPYTWRIAAFTFRQALYSTLGSLIIGLPGAYLLSHYRIRGSGLLKSLSTIPFVLPPIIVVLGFVLFYGNQGILNRVLMRVFSLPEPPLRIMYSLGAIILAHSFYNFPIVLRSVSAYWEGLSTHYEAAAHALGAKRLRVFITVTLPRLLPAIISASSLVFLFCFTSFAVILVLGGGPRFTTLEVEIYRQARTSLDLQAASGLALLSLAITVTLMLGYMRLQRTLALREEQGSGGRLHLAGRYSVIAAAGTYLYTIFALLFLLAPLASVVLRSFQAQTHRAGEIVWTLRWYRELFAPIQGAFIGRSGTSVLQSLGIALVTVAAATPLSLLITYGTTRSASASARISEVLLMIPIMVSSIILGLGYYLFSRNLGFMGPYVLIVCAHVTITLPFIYRLMLPASQKIYRTYAAASYVLGAPPVRTFTSVELPLLRGTVISGMVFVFALSMGEFNATLIVADASVQTIPILMYRLIGAYNFFGACALGTVLMLCSFAAFFLFDTQSTRSFL